MFFVCMCWCLCLCLCAGACVCKCIYLCVHVCACVYMRERVEWERHLEDLISKVDLGLPKSSILLKVVMVVVRSSRFYTLMVFA